MQRQKVSGPSITFLLLILVLLTLGFRAIQLTADPPADFSWSGGYFADEGYWSHNARSQVLFGDPNPDEWNARVVSPVFAYFQEFIFRVFGVGLAQVRVVGLFSALLLTVGTFLLFHRNADSRISFLCAVLVSLNYPLLVLARQGILDPFAAALAWIGLLLLLTESPLAAFLAGILFVCACVTKYLMVYAFVPMAAAMIILWKPSRVSVLIFIFGICLAGTVWLISNYLPNRELLAGYSRYYSSQQSWKAVEVLKNVITQPFYLYMVKTPAILFFGNLMLWFFLIPIYRAGKLERICWIWLLSGILFFALWRYRPYRYYTSLIPPLACLAGVSMPRLKEISLALRSGRSRFLIYAGLLIPCIQFLFFLLDRLAGWNYFPEQLGIHLAEPILFLGLTSFAAYVLLRPQPNTNWIWIAFLVVFLFGDMRSYLSWMLRPQYAAVEISKDLEERVGKGVITGQWAPELCLENKVRVVPAWHGFVNSDDPIQKYGITHLLLWRYPLGDETKLFEKWYPRDFSQFHFVKSYSIKNSEVFLYERALTREAK